MITPTTDSGLKMYDHLSPAEAIAAAWNEAGPQAGWHARARTEVRMTMPLLARAIERLTQESRS